MNVFSPLNPYTNVYSPPKQASTRIAYPLVLLRYGPDPECNTEVMLLVWSRLYNLIRGVLDRTFKDVATIRYSARLLHLHFLWQ